MATHIDPEALRDKIVQYLDENVGGMDAARKEELRNGIADAIGRAVAELDDDSGGGGAGTPASSVVDERLLDHAASVIGTSTNYARQDHSHGTPAMPSASDVGADASGAASAALATAEAYADAGDATLAAAVTTTLGSYQLRSEKGASSGYASLDGSTLVPVAQLPAATTAVKGAVVLATPSSDVTAGHVVQASDTRLSDARTPSGSISGDLAGSTWPALNIASSIITTAARTVLDDTTVGAMLTTLGGVPTTRTLTGTAPITVAGDNAAHDLSADRTIAIASATTGAVGAVRLAGQIGGTATSVTVTGITETGGPTALTVGAIADGQFAKRSGSTLIGGAGTLLTASRYDPDALTALSLITPSQEFADGVSAGGWTNVFDPGSTSVTSTIGANGLELVVTTPSAGYSLAGVYHSTFPVGDFAVLASFTLQGHRNKNIVGLVLMEGTGSTSDLFFCGLFQNTSQNEATRNAWSNGFTAYNTIGTDRYFQVYGGSQIYVFIRYNSSTSKVMVYLGKTPDSLINIVADLAITTPTKLGLVVNCGSTDLTRGTCQFVRVIADTYSNSDAAVLPRLTGARVTDH